MEYFDDIGDNDESLVRNKNKFVPLKGREELLDYFVDTTINIPLVPNEKSNIRRNMTLSEQKAISNLANDKNIIIKQVDKGGAIVIMNRSFYQKKIEKILFNNDYYKQLHQNPHKEIMKKYRSFFKTS